MATSKPGADKRFQLLVETVVDYGIFMLDATGHVASWNIGAQKLKGYSHDEIIGRHFSVFYPPEALAAGWPDEELRIAASLGRFEDEGWRVRKDGTQFWANVVITALREADGSLAGFAKITRDLTERRQHEETLRASEERFRLLIDSVHDYAIFMLDATGHVASWNAGAQAIKGYAAAEIIGQHFRMFYPPAERAAGRPEKELETAAARGRFEEEGWRVRKDGTLFWANVVVTAVRGADGALIGFAKVTRDMTERRKLEDLERSSRRMNEFLAMLAHELRNPLAPMRNAVSLISLDPAQGDRARWASGVIDRQLTHMTRLVDDLLDVGRLSTGKIALRKEGVDLREILLTCAEAARPMLEARSRRFRVDVGAEPVPLQADPVRVTQVLQNLLVNAAKFTPDGGDIALTIKREPRFVYVSVSDTGRGIEPSQLERIFELFAQGNTPGEVHSEAGLGIGLTLARSIVEMHGGALHARSGGPGRGSVFTFYLPTAAVGQLAN
ncbi:MAG TPA: PAS domain-containing sensor histidine kinase [Ramlibacter sp.]|nr:PAS domain-containing sensor histidine kinase [Ramlibacter sp.]